MMYALKRWARGLGIIGPRKAHDWESIVLVANVGEHAAALGYVGTRRQIYVCRCCGAQDPYASRFCPRGESDT